jgi:hypothetical protein
VIRVVLGLCVMGLVGCVPAPAPLTVNHAPVARLVVPQLWPLSQPVTADGSLSSDVDGDSLTFSVDWGDGTPSAKDDNGIAEHTYQAPGTYAVELTVEDPDGVPARASADVVIVDEASTACSCDVACFDEAVCTQRGCLLFASSTPGEEAPKAAFPDTIRCP